MSVNRYPGTRVSCGAPVPANGGVLVRAGRRWSVSHTACDGGMPRVRVASFAGGGMSWQNSRGRCEDAPCCGCCGDSY